MKECYDCKMTKSYDEYYSSKRNKDGYGTYCISCCKIRDAKYYKNSNKKQNSQKRIVKIRKIVSKFKQLKGCSYCQEKDSCCLEFHHLYGKDFTISQRLKNSWSRTKSEIRKCIVVCANCHRKIHAGKI